MTLTYKPIFELHLYHDFFVDGICKSLAIVPTSSTAEKLMKFRIRLVERPYGCEVFYGSSERKNQADEPEGKVSRLGQSSEVVEFNFILRPIDARFYNYSPFRLQAEETEANLSTEEKEKKEKALLDWTRGIFYLSNRELDEATSPVSSFDLNTRFPLLWATEPMETTTTAAAKAEAVVPPVALADSLLPADFALFNVVIIPPGVETDEAGGLNMKEDATFIPPQYHINIPTKSTRWRYHFINTDKDQFFVQPAGKLAPDLKDVVFSKTNSPLTLPSQTVTMVADRDILLRENYQANFSLSFDAPVEGTLPKIIMKLPNTDAGPISHYAYIKEQEDSEEKLVFYSDMYIYL